VLGVGVFVCWVLGYLCVGCWGICVLGVGVFMCWVLGYLWLDLEDVEEG
jgi:hypothetical protein